MNSAAAPTIAGVTGCAAVDGLMIDAAIRIISVGYWIRFYGYGTACAGIVGVVLSATLVHVTVCIVWTVY